jgi:DNA-binding CsgD family transcriptional regulator
VVALYDQRFGLCGHSAGIRRFFAQWPIFEDDPEPDVPASATALVHTQWTLCRREGEPAASALLLPDLLTSVSELRGEGTAVIAAIFRPYAERDPIRAATRHFQLTPREADVLKLMLRGMRASEIALRLGLSEMTIADYGKRLRLKAQARTQSGMIAALLGWEAPASGSRIEPEHAR